MMSRLLREPLVHFLGIGLALFFVYGLLNPASGDNEIRITRATIADLEARHSKLHGRPPSEAELKGLIEAEVADEILYREGLAMGLERDDAVIKRRVRQKYELIAEEEDAKEPSERDLEAFLKAHPEKFFAPPVVTFSQLILDETGGEDAVRARAEAGLEALAAGADPGSVGRPTLLAPQVEALPLDLVAREFGQPFAEALGRLPVGQWQGPVVSGYGFHLVRLESRSRPVLPPLGAVRGAVLREWENEARKSARAARIADLRARYDVVIEAAP